MARQVQVDEGFGEEGVVLEALGEYLLVDELGWCHMIGIKVY